MFIYMFNNHPLTIDPCQGNIILSIYLCSITTHYNMLDMLGTVWVIGTLIWDQPISKGLDHVYSKNSRLVHFTYSHIIPDVNTTSRNRYAVCIQADIYICEMEARESYSGNKSLETAPTLPTYHRACAHIR